MAVRILSPSGLGNPSRSRARLRSLNDGGPLDDNQKPQPLGGNEMPRFGGIATFMRLPGRSDPADLDVAVIGVPLDIGTSNRPGARFGPRGIRDESVLLRPSNMATRSAPFDRLRIDDVLRTDATVGSRADHDGVVTVAVHADQGDPAGCLRVGPQVDCVHAVGLQRGAQRLPSIVVSHSSHEGHRATEASRRHSLVGSLTTRYQGVVTAQNRLAGHRVVGDWHDDVQVG